MIEAELHGKHFFLRAVELNVGIRLIGPLALNDEIMQADGRYRSEEARILDEQIYFFTASKHLKLPEKQFKEVVEAEVE